MVFQDMFVHPDIVKHIYCHAQTAVHQFELREQDILEKLEIPVVAVRHIAAQHCDFRLCSHDSVAVPSHDLPYVRILFVRHDAGACSQLVRE